MHEHFPVAGCSLFCFFLHKLASKKEPIVQDIAEEALEWKSRPPLIPASLGGRTPGGGEANPLVTGTSSSLLQVTLLQRHQPGQCSDPC